MKLLISALLVGSAAAQIPAFPGAQGFGAYATGGRGGDVYYVTNVNAAGAGSLRNGIDTAPTTGRTIVFAVSGYIPGSNRIVRDKVTIAGQTAPGDGIGLRGNTLRVTGNNTIIRNLRLRHGKNGSGGDCLNVDSSGTDSIIDHVTMQFSTDENISFFSSALDNFTMQNSVTAWGLESHNAGGLWDLNRGSCLTSLWAHHHTRNPKARPGMLEWMNNVTFDWGIGFIMGDSETPAAWKANVRGCYFLSPPGRTDNTAMEKGLIARNGYPNFSLYLDHSLHDSDGDGLLNGTNKGYAIVAGSEYDPAEGAATGTQRYLKPTTPFPGATGSATVILDDALTAYKKVVSQSGAVRLDVSHAGPLRDEVDTVLFNHVVNQTPHRISNENALAAAPYFVTNAGFGTLNSTTAPIDTDLDGMPDYWEQALGFNPAVASHNTVFASTAGTFFPLATPLGYTHLEEYLHFKMIPHGVVGRNTAASPSSITIDLRKFTSGFSKSPVFTLAGVSGGTVVQSLTGGYQVVFTPTPDYSGRAKFDFTVADSDGSTWTRTFGLLVSSTGVPRDLKWAGGINSNAWDEVTANWKQGEFSTNFATGDFTTFDDSGTATADLTATVLPGGISVNRTQNLAFTGSGALAIGAGGLIKNGSGTLDVANSGANTIGGGILLQDGTLQVSGGGLGAAKVTLQGGNLVAATSFDLLGGLTVPAGITGYFQMPSLMRLGPLGGSGTLDLKVLSTGFRQARLNSAAGGFTGILNLIGTAPGAQLTAEFNGGGFDGQLGGAEVNLDNIKLVGRHNSGGNTLVIGALSGTSSGSIVGSGYAGAMTLSTGGLNRDTTFAGPITNGDQPTVLTKTGSGTLHLSGTNTYTGATTVSGGKLHVTGSLANTPVSLASGTTLLGTGTFGGVIATSSGATVSPGSVPGQGTTMNVGGINFTAPRLVFDLSATPAGGQNDKIQIAAGGSLNLSGLQTFQFNLTQGNLGNGIYNLIESPVTGGATNVTFASNLPVGGARQTFSLARTSFSTAPAFVQLTVGGSPAESLTWTGTGPAWDLLSPAAWTGAANPTFFQLDAVTFDNTATSGNVPITTAVAPASITVNNSSLAYQLSGAPITGTAALVKNGPGTLTLAPTILTLTSATTSGSPVLTPPATAGIFVGMTVTGTGIPAESLVTAVGATTVTISKNATATSSADLTYASINTYSGGTFLNQGTIVLATDHANSSALGSGPVTFGDGTTLTMYNNNAGFNNSAWDLIIPGGVSATLNADARVYLLSDVSGAGNLTLRIPYIRTDIVGDWSAFTGTLDITTDADGGEFRIGTATTWPGFPNTIINLPAFMTVSYIGAVGETTIPIGALSGPASAKLRGGPTAAAPFTYRIGGRNTDATFAGSFEEQSASTLTHYVKTGTGTWTLAGSGNWNGSTSVEQGVLSISGTVECAGPTAISPGASLALTGGTFTTDAVTVSPGGNLAGHGFLASDLNCEGSFTGRGFSSGIPGDLTISGSAYFGDSSVLKLRVGEVSDTVTVASDLALAGTLQIAPGSGFGRHTIMTYGGNLNLGTVAIIGLTGGITAHLSTATTGQVVLVIDDSDKDGLPDSWETDHFQSLAEDPEDDTDGDGTPNLAELRLGLDPANGSSTFRATVAGRTLTWPSAPGIIFTVKRSFSLDSSFWPTLDTVTGGPGPTASFTDPDPFDKAFYRIEFNP